ncbi:MAG: peptide deformylase [Clostridiales bacterium]|nr:peptide deformylase [Clostridiales bacterium]
MIRPVVHDTIFLSIPSKPASEEDRSVGQDLMDTLLAHRQHCAGMAANMIGVSKNIIVFEENGTPRIMYNPVITQKAGEYETKEGCLSLQGERAAKRFFSVAVKFQDVNWKSRTNVYTGFTAQVIQHEMDHLKGILI